MAIDLGTANVLVYLADEGIVVREPCVVAVQTVKGVREVVAVGEEAKRMIGRTPGNIKAIRPLHDGVIADCEVTEVMLKYFVRKALGNRSIFKIKPNVVICVPCGVTQVERRAVEEAILQAGAYDAIIVEEPLAAASGAGLKIGDASGSMIVDLGGGTTEVAVIALGGIVLSSSLRVGGDELDSSIITYIKQKYNVLIGEMTAEALKRKIGAAVPDYDGGVMEVRGRNLTNGLPAILNISSRDMYDAMYPQLVSIVDSVRATLEKTPPELAADIFDSGIALTGVGALMHGMDSLLTQVTGIRTMTMKNPLDAVAIGIGKMMDTPNIEGVVRFKVK